MDIPPPLRLYSWLLLLMTLALPRYFPTFTFSSTEFDHNPSSTSYTYNRFLEIQERCGGGGSTSLLSSSPPSPLALDDERGSKIRNELSFIKGDWVQEPGGSPLPPIGHDDTPSTGGTSVFKLASFQVKDIDSVRRSKDMVSLSGRLVLSLTDDRSSMAPSSISVHLEGVYFEVDGERVMCFVGNTSIPSMTQSNIELVPRHEPRGGNYKEENKQQPSVVQNDQIMLVLRYPKVFTFSSRGVYGEMISFGSKADGNYFDKVHISSQLSSPSEYQFSTDEQLLSEVCSSNLDQNKVKLYEGDGFCNILKDILKYDILYLVVQSTGSSNNRSSNKLGPFTLESGTMATPLGILIHHVQCQHHDDGNTRSTAKVAAVLRIVRAWDQLSSNSGRTGLSTMTLSAEGIWRSGEQLCMVACVGSITEHHHHSSTNRSCNSRVCLSIPREFSITQRRLIFASVSSIIDGENETNVAPLLFEKVIHPQDLSYIYYTSQSYKYSKLVLKQARNLERRQRRSMFLNWKTYPSLSSTGAFPTLSYLADELSINVGAVDLAVLSLGSFIWGTHFRNDQITQNAPSNEEEEEEDSMIEVSGLLKLEASQDISLSFEGIYNQLTGQMHLVGCRDIQGFSNISSIEDGMDCEYEIRVEYPSTTTRWLLHPKARISINSKRDHSDPLYFPSISLMTHSFPYTTQQDAMILRELFEKTLYVLMVAISVQLMSRQLKYMDKSQNPTDIAASVSTVMVAIQTYGCCIPLCTNIATMFLLPFAIMGSLRLSGKVQQARVSHNQRALLNLRDAKAFFITLAVLATGYFLSLRASLLDEQHGSSYNPEQNLFFRDKTMDRSSVMINIVLQEVEGYGGIVQDLFLVPQAIGNALWKGGRGKKPVAALSRWYYIGFTALRVFIKVYECVRDPIVRGKNNWYGGTTFIMKDYDFYGNLRNMILAAAVIVVAIVVHLQQQQQHKCDEDQQKVDMKGKKSVMDQDLEEELLSGNAKVVKC